MLVRSRVNDQIFDKMSGMQFGVGTAKGISIFSRLAEQPSSSWTGKVVESMLLDLGTLLPARSLKIWPMMKRILSSSEKICCTEC